MNFPQIRQALLNLPSGADEPTVIRIFVSELLKALSFDVTEIVSQFPTGDGRVDFAVRKNTDSDIFIHTKSNPYLLLEAKGRNINLNPNAAPYKATVNQLKGYLLAANCKSVQWGIITNADHIQLFRKHGKVIYPASPCVEITLDNVNEIIFNIKQKIDEQQKALTVAIYNNKGGVGKTTTTVNLAAILAASGKRTLILDFDPNQQDLTNSLALKPSQDSLFSWLINKSSPLPPGLVNVCKFTAKSGNVQQFDIITSDEKLRTLPEEELIKYVNSKRLRQALEPLKSLYDYILIDSPPNWRFFSQSAIYAADVVLIPAKHNSIFSLENVSTVLADFIPEVQNKREDGGPIALHIFYNGETITDSSKQIADQAIAKIIQRTKSDKNFDLTSYFYPKSTSTIKDLHIFNIPSYAHIAGAAFSCIPAAYKNRTANNYYSELAKEYFLQ